MSRGGGTRLLVMALVFGLLAGGCELLDPNRPVSQPDTNVFGILLDVVPDDETEGGWVAKVKVGVPRAIAESEEHEVPEMEQSLVADILVGRDSVVIVKDVDVAIDDIAPGTEVVAIPVAGTTRMVGDSQLITEASMFLDFSTYARWQAPKLVKERVEPADPDRINSPGVECGPVPLSGGKILYFAAHYREPAEADDGWIGAQREGLPRVDETDVARERTYRTELTKDGWTPPALVRFPGLEDVAMVSVTWMNGDETDCLVTVIESDGSSWIGSASRPSARAAWGAVERLKQLGENVSDGVQDPKREHHILFVAHDPGGGQSDIFLYESETGNAPLPLQPQINTIANEFSPRVGPRDMLFFQRDDRQLVLFENAVREVRFPWPHRVLFGNAAPTADGKWLFFCVSKLRPLEPDVDLYVARLNDDLSLGAAVPVDEWRPE
jgi:hypothetical protein